MNATVKEIFKQLLIEFHKESIPKPCYRQLSLPELPIGLRKAYVFIGMRRSGKTWTLYQIMHQLIEEGLDPKKIVYINFEDDRLDKINLQDLQYLLDAYFELYPNNADATDLHFFLDEIHEVDGWEKFVRRILDKEKIQLYLTGSSAKLLSKEIASNLRGRNLVREIFPFSFTEFLSVVSGIQRYDNFTSKEKSQLRHYLQQFLNYGGFPETLNATPELHRELLQGYIDSVIYRDIIERHHVTQGPLLRIFLRFCLHNSSSLLSINKMYQTFKSQGYAVSKNTLYEFAEYFEDAYCLFSIPIFDFSDKRRHLKPKKIYPADQGLITAFTVKKEFENGTRLESSVFSKLRRETEDIYYYNTKTGKEIDFLIKDPTDKIDLFQVCTSLISQNTRQKEVDALREAMIELKQARGTIITLDEEESLNVPEGKIEVVPAWRWFLSKS